jgi:geranylgeranylglycerol-phosphate geranylgeranyltransferase
LVRLVGLRRLTLLAFYLAWQVAVCTNDVVDADLDAVANPERPIPSGQHYGQPHGLSERGVLAVRDRRRLSRRAPVLFALLAFTAAYWVYSMPPLRLKRWPVINPFLVALACLAATAAGFFQAAPGMPWATLPLRVVVMILIGFTLAANVKDVKDIAGDRQEGILTLPVLAGRTAAACGWWPAWSACRFGWCR